MKKFEILGEELWEANALEARRLWKDHPDDRWRLWEHSEVDAHLLDTPEQLAVLIQRKKEKPGRLI